MKKFNEIREENERLAAKNVTTATPGEPIDDKKTKV
jgi:hypothetical protein